MLKKQIAHDSTLALHPETPGKQRGGVPPNTRFAVSEHDHDDVATGPRSARDQAMTGGLRVTGLEPIAIRKPFQDLVGIFQLARATIGETENERSQASDRANRRVRIGGASDDGKIAGGRILAGRGV